MARTGFWKSDWFLGVAVAVAVFVISRTDFVQNMKRKAYDLGVRAFSNRNAQGPHRRDRQGQLDVAFDKFKKCPLDDQLMDTLHNLGLDFQRKRRFNKAQSVFELMSTHNPKFRDLDYRTSRAKAMSETAILTNGGGRGNAGMLVLDGGTVEKPMLGRYQVEKELGNGAMGVVYLGKDPKIGINPVTLNSALPDCLVGIINRALAKQTQERIATGDQTAKAIRECAEIFGMVDEAL